MYGCRIICKVRTTNNMTSMTFTNVRDYLTTPFHASLQVGDHPSLPISLAAVDGVSDPITRTHGKEFRSIQHLFNHYNKYNAGSVLDRPKYLKNHCHQLLECIVFQDGPYNQLSLAKTLELSPAEWAEMPALEPIDSVPTVSTTPAPTSQASVANVTVREARQTVSTAATPVSPTKNSIEDVRLARKKKITELRNRCDEVQRGIIEINARYTELEKSLTIIDTIVRTHRVPVLTSCAK